MMEKSIKQKRIEKRRLALKEVLDEGREAGPAVYWNALLIDSIGNVIDSVEWLDSSVGSVESSIDSVAKIIKRASDSADKLSKRIFWLTWALVIIGALALLVAGYAVFWK